jgi:hypothetical protein
MLTSAPFVTTSMAVGEFASGVGTGARKAVEEPVTDVEFELAVVPGGDLEDIGEIGY